MISQNHVAYTQDTIRLVDFLLSSPRNYSNKKIIKIVQEEMPWILNTPLELFMLVTLRRKTQVAIPLIHKGLV
jgi:hypothetical protein